MAFCINFKIYKRIYRDLKTIKLINFSIDYLIFTKERKYELCILFSISEVLLMLLNTIMQISI